MQHILRIEIKGFIRIVESILVMFCCITDVAVINKYLSYGLRTYMRYLWIVGLLIYLFGIKRKKITGIFQVLTIMMLVLIMGAKFNGYDLSMTLSTMSSPYLVCLFLEANKESVDEVVAVWCKILLILVALDAITMVLYPKGMYFDGLYNENWFLGYKTERLVYSLPLCVFEAFLNYKKKKKYGCRTYFIILFSCGCLFHSQATAAFVVMFLYFILLLLVDSMNFIRFKGEKKLVGYVCSYRFMLPVYAIVSILFFLIDNIVFLQNFVVNVLNKDATLTTRTDIWKLCFIQFLKHPIIGIGIIKNENFVAITNNAYAGSAHNMIWTILVAGGLLFLMLYVVMCVVALKTENENILERAPLCLGILCVWIIGITSSSFVLSVFGFCFYEVLVLSDLKQMKNLYSSSAGKRHKICSSIPGGNK